MVLVIDIKGKNILVQLIAKIKFQKKYLVDKKVYKGI